MKEYIPKKGDIAYRHSFGCFPQLCVIDEEDILLATEGKQRYTFVCQSLERVDADKKEGDDKLIESISTWIYEYSFKIALERWSYPEIASEIRKVFEGVDK